MQIAQASTRELEMEQLRRAIHATEKEIIRITQEVIPAMRHKQIRRHRELARQEIYQQQDGKILATDSHR